MLAGETTELLYSNDSVRSNYSMLCLDKYVILIFHWERYQKTPLNDGPISSRLRKVNRKWAACADEMQMQCGLGTRQPKPIAATPTH